MSRRSTARAGRARSSDTLPKSGPSRSTRGFIAFCCAALIVCAILKIPSLLYPRTEADERIYWQLAENLAYRGEYTLQGSDLPAALSPHIYDRPLFHHPPLFAALLVPFVLADAKSASVLVSWLGHFLAVIAVALIGRHALARHPGGFNVTSPGFWLPVLGVAADPFLMFVSRRIWIDSLLAGLVAIAMATAVIAEGRRRRITLAVAGFLLGLAALAKLTALILFPVLVLAAIREDATWKQRGVSSLAIAVPAALLFTPWLILFYVWNGVFVPSWVKPDAALMENFPFVRAAVERPWYYYLIKLTLIMPLWLVSLWPLVRDRVRWRDGVTQAAAGWFLIFVAALTLMGIDGYGFQTRHIAPAIAAVYVMVMLVLLDGERPVFLLACALTMLIGTVTGAMHLMVPQLDEILSLLRVGGLAAF